MALHYLVRFFIFKTNLKPKHRSDLWYSRVFSTTFLCPETTFLRLFHSRPGCRMVGWFGATHRWNINQKNKALAGAAPVFPMFEINQPNANSARGLGSAASIHLSSRRRQPTGRPVGGGRALRRRRRSHSKSAVAAALAFPNFASSECAGGSNFGYWLITSVAN